MGFCSPLMHGEEPFLSTANQNDNPIANNPTNRVIKFKIMIITLLGRAIFVDIFWSDLSKGEENPLAI